MRSFSRSFRFLRVCWQNPSPPLSILGSQTPRSFWESRRRLPAQSSISRVRFLVRLALIREISRTPMGHRVWPSSILATTSFFRIRASPRPLPLDFPQTPNSPLRASCTSPVRPSNGSATDCRSSRMREKPRPWPGAWTAHWGCILFRPLLAWPHLFGITGQGAPSLD